MILALDLGTKTGWAAAERNAPFLPPMSDDETAARQAVRHYMHGVFKGPPSNHGLLFRRFRSFLTQRIERLGVERLIVEAQPMQDLRSAAAAEVFLGLKACVDEIAYDARVPTHVLNTSTMQLHAVNTGRDSGKKKRAARLAAFGYPAIDDNQGDAIFVLSCWLAQQAAKAAEAAE
ncbi:hypothetical protein [Thalassobaculum litoreum]|uniref:Holliday junction resolvasome RuvABC endonuclease subunit n=1 Tax=Thalassobaculum litoreum DSM 18839 TaxID=1123362 RepID=A0A8G2BK22_9PROT|nr:hypothetical protein [Thalassobaculum litoreum]SDF82861.1 hypothetical protein SAMN05660686_02439 [Thalassobaculum litoreum DSM 18839]